MLPTKTEKNWEMKNNNKKNQKSVILTLINISSSTWFFLTTKFLFDRCYFIFHSIVEMFKWFKCTRFTSKITSNMEKFQNILNHWIVQQVHKALLSSRASSLEARAQPVEKKTNKKISTFEIFCLIHNSRNEELQ
jgi:hypothetical protein